MCGLIHAGIGAPYPYEAVRSPYSLVITDLYASDGFDGYGVRSISACNYFYAFDL
jgi:glycogen debranching enzyme